MIEEVLEPMPRSLLWTTAGHLGLAVACVVVLLAVRAEPVLGVHPALKPFKFAISIAIFLGTMGIVLPSLAIEERTREVVAALFAVTMVVEMVSIVGQALRGTTSHFNVRGPVDALVWNTMMLAIVVASTLMAFVALVATSRPLVAADGQPLPNALSLAWRAGLWLFLLVPLSGFAMGGRLRHSIGGEDGGPGLPFVNWSTQHGDLRVAHFFAMHAVQVLPLAAWALLRLDVGNGARIVTLALVITVMSATCIGALVQAFLGRPLAR